ncbi:hypothetical protein GG344DRAFT_83639 [Lentinula edodes]|nr:hypothetical protein GG344DRAFT_83639 [Lentinula edodes]
MDHRKLNRLFKRDYIPDSGGSDDNYEPSQLFTPTKKRCCDKENSSLLPPRPSALASQNANKDLAHSGHQSAKDGGPDTDNEELGVEPQKQELYEPSPLPLPSQALSAHPVYQINVDVHSVQLVEAKEQTSGALANFFNNGILTHTLASSTYAKVRLGRSQNTIRKMLELLDPSHLREYERLIGIETTKKEIEEELQAARMDVEKACAAQKDAEDRLEAAHTLCRDLLSLLQ